MNETGTWATPLIFLVWLWCVVAFVLSFWAGRPGMFRLLHKSGVVAMVAFVVFYVALIEDDSDAVAYPVAACAVTALVLWWLRRWAAAAVVLWASCALLAATGYGFMVFFGPAPLAVVATMASLFTGRSTAEP